MLLRLLRALAASCMAASFMAAAAQAGASAGERTLDAREMRVWLLRIQDAAHRRNFQGTFVVTAGGTVSSSRIVHFGEGVQQFERIDALDGQTRRVLRRNDVVYTLWPDSRTALVEQRDLLLTFPALLKAGNDHIADFYELRTQGTDRVAGHDAHVLLLKPKDNRRYGYRLWTERATNLLLRAEVIGEHNEVLEASAFSEVSIGIKPHPDSVRQLIKKIDGYKVVRPVLTPTRLDAEGWTQTQPVPGFEPVSCVKRPWTSADDPLADDGVQVLQAIYSDGLTYVSVFIEPYDAARHTRPMQTALGATQTLMRRQDRWWLTVVGDVPSATLRQFALGFQHRP